MSLTGTTTPNTSDLWETPDDVFQALDAEFHFTLDAAALEANAKCEAWYGPDHPRPALRDALKLLWRPPVVDDAWIFCNPPYSRWGGPLEAWIEVAIRTCQWWDQLGGVVMLLPAWTDRPWMGALYANAASLRFTPRIKFKDPSGNRRAPTEGSLIAVITPTSVRNVHNFPPSDPPNYRVHVEFEYAPWRK
jgi:phage N-6-adenine-methyltransferase